ncbi:hypothetical protein [Aestuariibius sp. HNIBRBA575]|uniref:hypothetical protein n=1 Tax=Aestuariibius sp. HNIBRBA575 TaxID=3233343 RepID=UPI0034A1AC4B
MIRSHDSVFAVFNDFGVTFMIRVLPFLLLASPAFAQTFHLPAGCEAYLTVQGKGCYVSHHFTCENDPAGLQRRVSMGEEGLFYAGAIDAETQWIESYHIGTDHVEELEQSPVDPANMTELMDTEIDTYDFRTHSAEIGTTRYVGRDTLTGQTVEIDGIQLFETTYDIRAYDQSGNELWHSVGREFISPQWRMFLSGIGRTSVGADSWETDETPVEFIFPGEPGFLSSNPKYDCGVMMSKLEISQ